MPVQWNVTQRCPVCSVTFLKEASRFTGTANTAISLLIRLSRPAAYYHESGPQNNLGATILAVLYLRLFILRVSAFGVRNCNLYYANKTKVEANRFPTNGHVSILLSLLKGILPNRSTKFDNVIIRKTFSSFCFVLFFFFAQNEIISNYKSYR